MIYQKFTMILVIWFIFAFNPLLGQQTLEKGKPASQASDKNPKYLTGVIKGEIIDETTQNPLPGTNVIIEGTLMGAAANRDGKFVIENVPSGIQSLRFQMMGYEERIISNVIVNPGLITFVKSELKSTVLMTKGVTVKAGYFHEAKDATNSNRSMDYEEIRTDPGSAEDIQRVVQALPSVVSGSDQDNEIIVRGGMPGENLFIMDNIEVPNLNHFGYQGTGGGPINMLNPYFVRRMDFYAGAFPAKYGDKASSVMDISLRDGNRERTTGHIYIGMSGAGAMAEGPIAKGRGTWIASARKSFLDLIISSTGLTAVPHYYSLQGKGTYDLSKNHRLLINGIYGDDEITIEDTDNEGYSRGAENVRSKSHQYAFGGTLRSLYGKLGVSDLTLSQTLNNWDQYVYHDNKLAYYTNLSTEIERTLNYDLTLIPTKRLEFNVGAMAKVITINHNQWLEADTLFIYNTNVNPHQIIDVFATYPEWQVIYAKITNKYAFYDQLKYTPHHRIILTAGIRWDYFRFIKKSAFDPRLGISYRITKSSKINLGIGRHSQAPAYVSLTSHPDNKNLDYKYTNQIVLGLENLFREDIRGTLEVFYKDYHNVPVGVSGTTPDPYDRSEGKLLSEGKGYSKGIELFIQKKITRNYHFTLSYAYAIAKGFDPRFDEYFNWDYDYRHIFTFISGIRLDFRKYNWYNHLKEKFWYHFVDWIMPFGDQTEVSIRWRYLGGRPVNQPDYISQLHYWIINENSPRNTQRLPSYQRVDLRLDRRFMFNNWNIVTYFDIMNVFGRDNLWGYSYNSDGTIEEILQWKVFPVGGFTVEF